jgi:hypothetical protein
MLAELFPTTTLGLFFLTLNNIESLLRICKLGLSLLLRLVSLLLLDHGIIQIFGFGSQVITGSSIGGLGSLQRLGQLGLISS